MEDLERILAENSKSDKRAGRKVSDQRRFIVVEGLYRNFGDIVPIDKVDLSLLFYLYLFFSSILPLCFILYSFLPFSLSLTHTHTYSFLYEKGFGIEESLQNKNHH